MTKEEKDLLVKDLCCRLPYGVKFECNNVYTAKGLDLIVTDEGGWEYAVTAKGIVPIEIDFIKPYLYPLSSMTEEQSNELEEIDQEFYSLIRSNGDIYVSMDLRGYDWLNKNNFDYRGLIKKGLAIDATNLGIYENKIIKKG